jgi:pyruvate dehydrogenase E1 component alpha subunit
MSDQLIKQHPEKFIAILSMMKFIRTVEQGIADRYAQGQMRCPTHLSIGQECPPSVLSQFLEHSDFAVSTHRAHAHYLAKGGDVKAMLAEIYGKETGCCRGRGGSMHLIDESVGFKGSTAIVGNTIPIGVGLALSKKLREQSGLSVVFIGDGAIEEGVFYESANFAAVQNLPVVFFCENNRYSVYSGLEVRQPPGRKIHEMVSALGLNTFHGDGNDAVDTFECINQAISSVKNGEGPVFIELDTYRWLEHCGPNYDNDIGYRSEQEFLAWKAEEPIQRLTTKLIDAGVIQASQINVIQSEIDAQVKDAFEFAQNSDFPNAEQAFSAVFA